MGKNLRRLEFILDTLNYENRGGPLRQYNVQLCQMDLDPVGGQCSVR